MAKKEDAQQQGFPEIVEHLQTESAKSLARREARLKKFEEEYRAYYAPYDALVAGGLADTLENIQKFNKEHGGPPNAAGLWILE